jgi:hypothetical protein
MKEIFDYVFGACFHEPLSSKAWIWRKHDWKWKDDRNVKYSMMPEARSLVIDP